MKRKILLPGILIASVLVVLSKGLKAQQSFESLNAYQANDQSGNSSYLPPYSINSSENKSRTNATPPWWVQRFRASVGLFIPVNNTEIEVGNQQNTFGTTINFEDNLGFSKSTATFLGNFQWRASRRSRFDLSYFHVDRNSNYTLKKDVEFGDHTYPVNADVNSFFKTNIFRFSYGYALLSHPKYELGLMLGAHIVKSDVGISATGATASLGYSDDFGFTAPLPDVGIWGGYAFTNRLAFNGEISYLSLKVNDVDGQIFSYNVVVMYEVLKNFDVALGYTGLNFNVDVDKEKLHGYLKWGYNGPSLSASYAFGKKKW
ncbi:hypothetical protein GS399_19910 [Pedobacter sp. HMF7647]|uniref:Uncharacterized protein n=1 Tax=Hufsiella arboris TaxID=2695275 RepID=A0A7K1YGC6_9SPHI|nr:hypothetical protein [Hufsiella arboris]MXV53238.1 hypothetical protein [Hufsiella arboris]